MWSNQAAFDSDNCPVADDLLGAMYRANPNGLAELTATVPDDVRAMLALFCYRRNHLHGLGLSIAATCSERDLVEQGGRAGATLYAQSRAGRAEERRPAAPNRRGITLSTTPLRTLPPLDDSIDDDDEPPLTA